jgi:hypothetical protein
MLEYIALKKISRRSKILIMLLEKEAKDRFLTSERNNFYKPSCHTPFTHPIAVSTLLELGFVCDCDHLNQVSISTTFYE